MPTVNSYINKDLSNLFIRFNKFDITFLHQFLKCKFVIFAPIGSISNSSREKFIITFTCFHCLVDVTYRGGDRPALSMLLYNPQSTRFPFLHQVVVLAGITPGWFCRVSYAKFLFFEVFTSRTKESGVITGIVIYSKTKAQRTFKLA